ncbi:hypothetical protein [Kitasatospora sp. NPDC057223]|uniref:hypothetical protein n=1 Tax=Kitasatospora sp. NPDC057223 TaxID=3346055 RepID=UPI003628A25C
MRRYSVPPGGRRYRPAADDRLPVGMSGVLALVAGLGLAYVLSLVGELRPTWFALGAFALLSALLGRASRPAAAPLIGGAAWLVLNGFVVHRYATLGWDGSGTELARLGLFAGAALLAALPAALPRRRIHGQPLSVPKRPLSEHR